MLSSILRQQEIVMQNNNIKEPLFISNIELLDSHIHNVLKNCMASYSQVSCLALTVFGFILSHGGMKNTSLMMLDFSDSGTGKSANMDLQYDLLLRSIVKQQNDLQIASVEEDRVSRYINVIKGNITVPALYQCVRTVRAQLLMFDELGLILRKNDGIINEITKLYGANEVLAPIIKTEAPSSNSLLPVALSFFGATTLAYFGSKQKFQHHLSGGFVNRALIVYNNRLKRPEEIMSTFSTEVDCTQSNQIAVELLAFIRSNVTACMQSESSENALLEFAREIQAIRFDFNESGHEYYGLFYNRIVQNTKVIINILHGLKCFEKKSWDNEIDIATTQCAITFMKQIMFSEIEKMIDYLSDSDLLKREEKYKAIIIDYVKNYLLENGKMPKIKNVSNKTHLPKKEVLKLTDDFLKIVPGTTIFRYINESH